MKNVIVIGYRCTGKSSAGRQLAERMGVPFFDTDELIVEREGMSIREIVETGGWHLFREKEKEVAKGLRVTEGSVIATGGGLFDDSGNRALLRRKGIFFWLTANEETIIERMMNDHRGEGTRPSLAHSDLRSDVVATLGEREPIYRQMADFTVNTSGKAIQAVVDEIYGILKGRRER